MKVLWDLECHEGIYDNILGGNIPLTLPLTDTYLIKLSGLDRFLLMVMKGVCVLLAVSAHRPQFTHSPALQEPTVTAQVSNMQSSVYTVLQGMTARAK